MWAEDGKLHSQLECPKVLTILSALVAFLTHQVIVLNIASMKVKIMCISLWGAVCVKTQLLIVFCFDGYLVNVDNVSGYLFSKCQWVFSKCQR